MRPLVGKSDKSGISTESPHLSAAPDRGESDCWPWSCTSSTPGRGRSRERKKKKHFRADTKEFVVFMQFFIICQIKCLNLNEMTAGSLSSSIVLLLTGGS